MNADSTTFLIRIRNAVLVVTAIWTVLFPILVLAIWGTDRQMRQWPTVTATASDHKIVRHRATSRWVVATVTYDHPTLPGAPKCTVKEFQVGLASNPSAFRNSVDLAVRPGSCYDPGRLPLPPKSSWPEWLQLYVSSGAILSILAVIFVALGYLTDKLKARRA